jgi:hypothetical protein
VSRHPSLAAELVPLTNLDPRATMGRNDPCWCRSGLKWKKCHRDRDKMSPLPLSDILERGTEIRNKSLCLHPLASEDCSDRIIAAHSVQRRVGLKAIEENGHVLSFLHALTRKFCSPASISPERIGVSRASTFRGFCEKHDAALFRPIEAEKWDPTKENAFLFSFRAVCYEYYAKLVVEEIGEWQKMWVDRGKNFLDQIADQQFIEDYLKGVRHGMRDGAEWKTNMIACIHWVVMRSIDFCQLGSGPIKFLARGGID